MGKPITDTTPEAERRRQRYAERLSETREFALSAHALAIYQAIKGKDDMEAIDTIKQYLGENFKI